MCTRIKYPAPVKLFMAVLYTPEFPIEDLHEKLTEYAGKIDDSLHSFPFKYTNYYASEMGVDLQKYFISFESLIPPDNLVNLKLFTIDLENQYKTDGKRCVNIDPGYICPAKVVLSTTKDYSHRLYLGKGIFGDVHLQYQKGKFVPNTWTYPDYKKQSVIEFLLRIRSRFMEQLAFVNQQIN